MALIHFTEDGNGPPLLFLHGFCDSHAVWSEFKDAFVKNYRVLTPDLPGFGDSELLPTTFSIDNVGDALAGWFKNIGIGKPLVIGHSLGGYVGLALLDHHPKMISGLILFHSTPYPDSPDRRKVRDKVIDFVEENGVPPFIETFVPGLFANKNHPATVTTRARALKTKQGALVGYAKAMRDRPDRSEVLLKAKIPTLIIGGERDALIPISDLRKIAEISGREMLFELPESAHMGIFEAKEACQRRISVFASEVFKTRQT